jgi:uncharacterized protein (DUF1697 family)
LENQDRRKSKNKARIIGKGLFLLDSYLWGKMENLVALLRGINVSGQKKIPMKELKELFLSMGLSHVSTYIQSGNVVFKAASRDGLSERIQVKIREEFGFDVPVLIRNLPEIEKCVINSPFSVLEQAKTYVVFLEQKGDLEGFEKLLAYQGIGEKIVLSGKEIYLLTESYGNTKLNNNFIENKLKIRATTRNWNTVQKLLEMLQSLN